VGQSAVRQSWSPGAPPVECWLDHSHESTAACVAANKITWEFWPTAKPGTMRLKYYHENSEPLSWWFDTDYVLSSLNIYLPSVLWHCWFGVRKSIRPVKSEWWGVGVVICLQRGVDCLHMVQLIPHTHTHPFNGPLSRTTRAIRYQKGKTNLDFTEARDSEWQWHQLGHMQVCTSLQTGNHTSTPPLSFLQAGW